MTTTTTTLLLVAVLASVLPACSGFAIGSQLRTAASVQSVSAAAPPRTLALRMEEEAEAAEEAEVAPPAPSPAPAAPAPATAAAKSSPLAGLVGDQTLDDFQAKKERDNAKRLATRKITNIAIPAVTLSFLAVCTFFGEEKTKAFFAEFDNPMSNAPGFEQAKAAKAERKAQAKAEQEELIKALRVKVRGEAAVQSSD